MGHNFCEILGGALIILNFMTQTVVLMQLKLSQDLSFMTQIGPQKLHKLLALEYNYYH